MHVLNEEEKNIFSLNWPHWVDLVKELPCPSGLLFLCAIRCSFILSQTNCGPPKKMNEELFENAPTYMIIRPSLKSWLELTARSLVPLATLKSKVRPIQLAQDTAGSQKCCL